MITPNRLKLDQRVRVEVYNTNGNLIADNVYTGLHTVEDAILTAAKTATPRDAQPEDFVYKVSNLSDGTSERYMLNAHGHARLIT